MPCSIAYWWVVICAEQRPENVIATYGMTETGSGIVYNGHPLEGVELRIVNGDAHTVPDVVSVLPQRRYPFTADGWYPTGDSGSLDSSGVLTVFGRMGEMIITGGENVWPVAVERIFRKSDFCCGVCRCGTSGPRVGKCYRDRGAG